MATARRKAMKRASAPRRAKPARKPKSSRPKSAGPLKPGKRKSAGPKSEITGLQRQLSAAQDETREALERQTATAEILKVIASSPSDVQPVFAAIVANADRLIGGYSTGVYRFIGGICHLEAFTPVNPAADEMLKNRFPRPIAGISHFELAHAGETVEITDTEIDAADLPLREIARARGFRSVLYSPLMSKGTAIGVIVVSRRNPGSFSAHHVELLRTFSNQAVIAIENARLFNEVRAKTADLQESLQQQTATADVLKVISRSAFDLENILDTLIESAARLCAAERATLIHQKGGTYVRAALHGFPSEAVVEMKNVAVDMNSATIASRALRQCAVVHVADVNTDPDYPKTPAQTLGGVRTVLSVPLVREGRPIGAITLSRTRVDPFTPKQIELIRTFADQAVIAIENARLFNETREALERQTATADILKVIASSPDDVQPVFEAIAERANKLVGGHAATVLRIVGDMVDLAAFTPVTEQADKFLRASFPLPITGNPDFERLRRGELAETIDTESEMHAHLAIRNIARARGFRSRLLVPLKSEGGIIGAISVTRVAPGAFAEHHVQLLQTFADQAVIAIQNVRLFNETREALAHQTATSEVLQAIGISMADTQPVFERILDSVERLFDIRQCSVILARDGMLHLVARRGIGIEATDRLFPAPMAQTSGGEVIRTGQQTYVSSAASAEGSWLMRQVAEVMGDYSVVMTPLVWEGQGIGMISAARAPNAVFSDKELTLLRTFANQAVIAIENARLFNELQARTRDLSESLQQQTATADVLKVISRSAFDLQTVLQTLVESAAKLCNASFANIRIRDGDVLRARAFVAVSEDLKDFLLDHPLERDRGHVVGRAFLTGEMVHVPDVLSDPEYDAVERARRWGYRAVLAVPMIREGRVEGIFSLVRPEPGPYSDREIELVRTFVDQALIAIENVRLFNETQEALERQTATADILKVIASSPSDVQPVFEAIAASANRLIGGFSTAVIRFVDGMAHLAAFTPANPAADAVLKSSLPAPTAAFKPFELAARGEPTQIADIEAFADERLLRISRARGYRSALFAPLMNGSLSIGLIAVTRVAPGTFAPHHVQLLKTFADQAVIAIENARLFNETQEALERQTATADILKVIASSPDDVQPVFEAIAERSNRLVNGLSTAVFSVVDDAVRLMSFTSVSATADAALKAITDVPLSAFPIGEAMRKGEVAQIPDAEDEATPDFLREVARLRGWRSSLTVPMLREGILIGIIAVTRVEPGLFDDHHVQLLKTFADQAVIAIGNVRLFDEVQAKTRDLTESLEQQTATSEVLEVISSSPGELQPVFHKMLENATRVCGANFGTMNLWDGEKFTIVADHNIPPEFAAYRQSTPLHPHPNSSLAAVVSTHQAAQIHDLRESPGYLAGIPPVVRMVDVAGARTLISVPMLKEDELVGAITIFRQEVRPFTDKQVALVENFTKQAVIAIENTRLLKELRQRTDDLTESLEQQTATSEVLQVISSSPGELAPVFEKMLENATRVCGANFGVMHLWDGDSLTVAADYNVPPAYTVLRQGAQLHPHPESGLAAVIRTHQVAHIDDMRTSPTYLARAPHAVRIVEVAGARTLVIVPMLKENELIGAITIYRQEVRPFTDKQIALVENFTKQAVIAIENTRLLRELRERTDDLTESLQFQTATSDVLKVISSSPDSLQPVLDGIVNTSRQLCGAEASTIFLLSEGKFQLAAASGTMPEYLESLRNNPIAPDQPGSATARAAREKRTIHIPDIGADPEFGQGPMSLGDRRALLSVPLMREGMAVGVITMRQSHLAPFTPPQIEVVETFADQAVIAISNVRLFEQVQERTRELSLSLDDLRAAQDRLVQTEKLASLGQLTAGIAHEIKNPLNFVNNFSALSAELTDELNDVLKPAALGEKMRGEVDELTKTLKDNLEKVVQHGKRADSIVKNMLLHSREGSGEQRPADINALLDESLNLAYHGARAEKPGFNITLQRDFDADAGTIELFPQEITRAFLNLISNGFYAANRRKAEDADAGFEPTLHASTKNLGSTVEIRIRDNGTGIPPEVKEKMFNPFFTTKPAGEGTGLGLSMSHDIIVKQHGGAINVASEPGQFTELTIVLPRTANSPGKTRPKI